MAPKGVSHQQVRKQVAALTALQHAAISRRQAKKLGLSSATISRRLSSGDWVRVLPSVYALAGAPHTQAQRLASAALWAGPDAAVSHRTALHVWGYPCSLDLVDVLTAKRRDPQAGIFVHQVRRYDSGANPARCGQLLSVSAHAGLRV